MLPSGSETKAWLDARSRFICNIADFSHLFSPFFSESLHPLPCLLTNFISSFLGCNVFFLPSFSFVRFHFFFLLRSVCRSCRYFVQTTLLQFSILFDFGNFTFTILLIVLFVLSFLFLNLLFPPSFHLFSI